MLTGTCNRCGNCCTGERAGIPWRCEHLEEHLDGTRQCAVYLARHDAMPIRLIGKDGSIRPGLCAKNSAAEERVIREWIRKGQCSLVEVSCETKNP